MFEEISAYLGLFISAFGAATLLPLQSEAVLASLLITNPTNVIALLIIATTGNVLGSVVNWWIGKTIEHFRNRRWFPVSETQLNKAQNIYHRYGYWSLLVSWTPIIGDPITIVAGFMREPLWRFLLIVTVAKAGRYLAVAAITLKMYQQY